MIQDLVTVVVPIYNVEKYLDSCILSIVNQTYKNLEILLIDDGSPDRCPEICDKWAGRDDRIRVIHKENAGLGMARNTGIENARGRYICFFDSDDTVVQTLVEKAYSLATETDADVVLFGMKSINAKGETVQSNVPETEKYLFTGEEFRKTLLPDIVDAGRKDARNHFLPMSAWSCLFSAEFINSHNWRFQSERKIISEDTYSLLQLYAYARIIAVLPEALYCYRINEQSLTRVFRQDRFERCKHFYRCTLTLVRESGYDENMCQRIAGIFMSFTIGALKQLAASPLKPGEQRRIIRQIVNDTEAQHALTMLLNTRYASKAKNIFYAAMRKKYCTLVWILLKLQNFRSPE